MTVPLSGVSRFRAGGAKRRRSRNCRALRLPKSGDTRTRILVSGDAATGAQLRFASGCPLQTESLALSAPSPALRCTGRKPRTQTLVPLVGCMSCPVPVEFSRSARPTPGAAERDVVLPHGGMPAVRYAVESHSAGIGLHVAAREAHGARVALHGCTVRAHGSRGALPGPLVEIHGAPMRLHERPGGVPGGSVGVHGAARKLHGGGSGVHGGAVALHGRAMSVPGAGVGVHGRSGSVHSRSVSLHGGAGSAPGRAGSVPSGFMSVPSRAGNVPSAAGDSPSTPFALHTTKHITY